MRRVLAEAAFAALTLVVCAAGARADEAPASLADRIESILARPAAQRANWGVLIVDAANGEELFAHNSPKLFIPASNAKLYASALALTRLGPETRFQTRVLAQGPVENGVLAGNLALVGGGDPNLSSRQLPYNFKLEFRDDRLEPMRELAKQVVAAGVEVIEGDIIGDASRYVWDPYPPGWDVQDLSWGYGAPVSALAFNDNRIDMLIRPGLGAGAPAQLRLEPKIEYFTVRNLTRTAATRTVARRLEARVMPGQRRLDVWGQISQRSPGREMEVAVDDPALYAALALRQALEDEGVEVRGGVRARYLESHEVADLKALRTPPEEPSGQALAVRESAPLAQILQALNKDSHNLHAEMLLREVGYQRRNVGTLEAGIEEMRDFLKEIGLTPWEFFVEDGSGLSRKNLVSPEGTVKLLQAMGASEHREVWLDSLPVAGEDGTLDWRFSKTLAKGRVRAKTGTLSHVTALAGYATALDGRELAFAVFVNNFGVSTSYVRNLLDEIVVEAVAGP
jgi:D-alanyl-D-alanine carboxypeptidase/D-alanyl-D-alanine-endopeptidase (penicillin-binding protein 4)